MIDNIILVPLLFFSLFFSSLMLSFSFKKFFSDKILFYFSHFLMIMWIFSLIELLNYFGVFPKFLVNYLPSILLFLLHYFLMFQYLFVARFLFKFKNLSFKYLFIIIFTLWSIFFSLPSNIIFILDGDDKVKQFFYFGLSLLPAVILICLSVYYFFKRKYSIAKKTLLIIIAGLVSPIIVVSTIIITQPESLIFSLDAIFVSLLVSMCFYTIVLYLDKNRKILKSFKDKIIFISTLLVMVPLTFRTMYIYSVSRDILTTNTIQNIEEENEHHVVNITSSFEKHVREVTVLSQFHDLVFIDDDELSRKKSEDIFISFLKNSEGATKISFVDVFGNEKLRVDKEYKSYSVTQPSKLVTIKSQPNLKFPINKKDNFIFISEAHFDNNRQIIQFASPVFLGDEILGLVILDVDVQTMFNYFLSHNITHNQYIIDLNGVYVYHDDLEKVLNSSNIQDDLNDVWQFIQSDDKKSIISDDEKIYSYSKIEIYFYDSSHIFYVIHEEDVSTAFTAINDLSYTLIGTLVVVTLVVFILIYLLTSYLTNPFLELILAVKNFDYVDDSFFKKRSSKEVEDLADAFLNMISKVKNSKVEVSRQVEDQTKQIYESSERLEKQRAAMINLIEDIDSQREVNLLQATDLKKFKLAIDGVSELIVITDNKGKVIYVNPAVKNITGFDVKEVMGSKVGQLWSGIMPESWYANFWHIISEKKEKFVGHITNKKKNGKKFISQITVQPLLDNIGNIQHYVSVQRDITEEIKIDRMKTDFISLASHQLRTPLSAMKWFLEMMLNGDLGELNSEQTEVIENVEASNNRMISLVNALLNISRIESGRIIVNPVKINIIDLVKTIIISFNKQFDKKQQKVLFRVDSPSIEVSVDKDLVTQIIINLLTNANKYTNNKGNITITVKQIKDFIVINVIDDGFGIPNSEKENIFQRFYRATNVVKKVTDGTGLGLYIAKAITETLGGTIGFASEEGKGSNFWFTIPLSSVKKKKGEVTIMLNDI